MNDQFRVSCLITAALALAGCGGSHHEETAAAADRAPTQNAEQFVARINSELREVAGESATASWVQSTYITPDTGKLAARAQERYAAFLSNAVAQAGAYDLDTIDPTDARAIEQLRLGTSQPAPNDAVKRRELSEITTSMESIYGAGEYCPGGDDSCKSLGELVNVLAENRDYDAQLDAWLGWRTVSSAIRPKYERFVTLANEGARELGYGDLAEMWKSGYDMSTDDFDAETSRLWSQVEPLYEELHCYVRRELAEEYGEDRVPLDEPIPAHLLGNMWSQQWGNIFELVKPFPDAPTPDVNKALVEQGYTPKRMVETAEDFFVSLGLPELPDTFYERSLLTQPQDRDVVCHASAWPLEWGEDVRIKMCIEPTFEMLSTIYHELGHIYYFLAYKDQPPLFQAGAHDGFHEGIGDTITLSLTPGFMQTLGLAGATDDSEQALINTQMRMALDKIAFLPFGKLIDEWRWRVFAGEITPENYNAAWWELRRKYQGVKAPVERTEADFDPGAKYHIPANTPYTRYFLAHILQFQFQKALCDTAGFDGPLHACSIYGSKEAGAKLQAMLAAGSSQPWQDSMERLTGTRTMDASAITDYFAPLMGWLEAENAGQSCGW